MEQNINSINFDEIKHGMKLTVRKKGQSQEKCGRVLEWRSDNQCKMVKEVGIYLEDGNKLKLNRESIKNYTVRVVKE